MAKKRARGSTDEEPEDDELKQGILNEEWVEKLPEEVQSAADKYRKAQKAKSKGDANFNTEKSHLIDVMTEHHISKVRVDIDGEVKFITAVTDTKLKIEKPENPEYVNHAGALATAE